MLRRLLFLILAAVGIFWWLWRLLGRGLTARPASASRGPHRRPEGSMVRDRICNTFLPRSRALSLQVGSEQHFFCSEQCRDAFLARSRT